MGGGGGGGANDPPSFMVRVNGLTARGLAIMSSCFLCQFDCFFGDSGWKTGKVENC